MVSCFAAVCGSCCKGSTKRITEKLLPWLNKFRGECTNKIIYHTDIAAGLTANGTLSLETDLLIASCFEVFVTFSHCALKIHEKVSKGPSGGTVAVKSQKGCPHCTPELHQLALLPGQDWWCLQKVRVCCSQWLSTACGRPPGTTSKVAHDSWKLIRRTMMCPAESRPCKEGTDPERVVHTLFASATLGKSKVVAECNNNNQRDQVLLRPEHNGLDPLVMMALVVAATKERNCGFQKRIVKMDPRKDLEDTQRG